MYELKQYKRGLKVAEQILKKHPEHGESMAMKGLFCHCLERREEGIECVKKGLRWDLKSHICWHVYGLVHRADRNYEEAIRCYAQALKCDGENLQILRDFAMLQVQMRKYEQFADSRNQLLSLRPQTKQNWFGLAVAYHFLGKFEMSEKVLLAFLDANTDPTPGLLGPYEDSEMFHYHNMVIEELGDFDRALEHLDSHESLMLDKTGWLESKARLLLKKKSLEQAEEHYHLLMERNSESIEYINRMIECKGFEGDDKKISELVLPQLLEKFPRSHVIPLLQLQYSQGQNFKKLQKAYLIKNFQRGVPSLFKNLRHVLMDASKYDIIFTTATEYLQTLLKSKTELPTTLIWVRYFISQVHDDRREYQLALDSLNLAIVHSPTVVELFMAKAKIYKHAGDLNSAMEWMNQARELDLQDRYVNSKCTKYMINNNQIRLAEKTISLFTNAASALKPDAPKDDNPNPDLIEMQCMWYSTAIGKSYKSTGDYGLALKSFHQVEQHFVDIYDDQFDFHAYGLRKMTLRAYVDMVRSLDRLRDHPFFTKVAKAAIEIYLDMFDNPSSACNASESVLF